MYRLSTHERLRAIPKADWNRLADADAPFLRHEFLDAMERHGCVGESLGWLPHHLALYTGTDALVAAAPCYLKFNSYGELVFDWAWADAYRRHGLAYYPKLVVASPYTPATGPRLLIDSTPQGAQYATALAEGALQVAERLGVSSLHWLFTTPAEARLLHRHGLLPRIGCQFHWNNPGYRSFDDFLATLTAEKRKKVKRERRRVEEAGIHIERRHGDEITEAEWVAFHRLYRGTFDKHGGIPTLTLPFFQEIATTMGRNLLLVFAWHGQGRRTQDLVAAAFNLVGNRTLFGRHWGCGREFHSLHFETCYYQGIDYCIEQGLTRFEPGAQGEHKVSRGFLPTTTWSAHWIADPHFRDAIARFLVTETQGMNDYQKAMLAHTPYRESPETRFPRVSGQADTRP
jgi:uncharacterized protein